MFFTVYFYFILWGLFLNFLFCTGEWLTNNAVIVSGEQQRDPAIHTHVSILLQSPLPSRPPQNIEQSSMCCSVGPCQLSILNTAVCICPLKLPNYPFPPFHPPTPHNHKFVLQVCDKTQAVWFKLRQRLKNQGMTQLDNHNLASIIVIINNNNSGKNH